MVSKFEDLDVYQKAYETALAVHKTSLGFPKIEQFALADQLRRASKSICGNIAEGFGKQHKSKPEFKRYLLIAIGSSEEMQVWIKFAYDLKYINEEQWRKWQETYRIIARQLNNLHSNWKT